MISLCRHCSRRLFTRHESYAKSGREITIVRVQCNLPTIMNTRKDVYIYGSRLLVEVGVGVTKYTILDCFPSFICLEHFYFS